MNDQNQQTHAQTKLALLSAWVEYRDRVNELERENAALRADKERIEFLMAVAGSAWVYRFLRDHQTLSRDEIDFARKEAQS